MQEVIHVADDGSAGCASAAAAAAGRRSDRAQGVVAAGLVLVVDCAVLDPALVLQQLVLNDPDFLDEVFVHLDLVLELVFQVLDPVLEQLLVANEFCFSVQRFPLLVLEEIHDPRPRVHALALLPGIALVLLRLWVELVSHLLMMLESSVEDLVVGL